MGIKIIDNLTEKVNLQIPLSIGEAVESVKRKLKRNKETEAAHKRKEFPIHYTSEKEPDQMAQQRFLTYALFLIQQERPDFHSILHLRMRGFTLKKLAAFLSKQLNSNISEAQVSRKEAEAIRYVKQKIEHLRKTGIPIFEKQEGLAVAGA